MSRYTQTGLSTSSKYWVLNAVGLMSTPTKAEIVALLQSWAGEDTPPLRNWEGYTQRSLDDLEKAGLVVELPTSPVTYQITEKGQGVVLDD